MNEQTSPAISTPNPVTTDSPTPPEQAPTPEAVEVTTPNAVPVPTSGEGVLPPEPETTPAREGETDQMAGNEPLGEPAPESAGATTAQAPEATTVLPPPIVQIATPRNRISEFLAMAKATIRGRKEKKLEKIMELVAKKGTVTNNEVEKLLHVSDATATRYLGELTKQGKIVRTNATGRGVMYRKV